MIKQRLRFCAHLRDARIRLLHAMVQEVETHESINTGTSLCTTGHHSSKTRVCSVPAPKFPPSCFELAQPRKRKIIIIIIIIVVVIIVTIVIIIIIV